MTDVDPAGTFLTRPTGVNNKGQICGWGPGFQAVLWQDGAVTNLVTGFSRAEGINAAGEIVGTVERHAFLWVRGEVTDLPFGEIGEARAINAAGAVVGLSVFGNWLWKRGALTNLGPLSPTARSDRDPVSPKTRIPIPQRGIQGVDYRLGRLDPSVCNRFIRVDCRCRRHP